MFDLTISATFAAAHQLTGYDGACEALHGHNWKVAVVIGVEKLDQIGIGMDFKRIKNITDNILSELDHRNLNETAPFTKTNPSSENIAMWIYARLAETKELGALIKKVTVYETENFSASYYEKT